MFIINIFSRGHGGSMPLSDRGSHRVVDHGSSGSASPWSAGTATHWYLVTITSSRPSWMYGASRRYDLGRCKWSPGVILLVEAFDVFHRRIWVTFRVPWFRSYEVLGAYRWFPIPLVGYSWDRRRSVSGSNSNTRRWQWYADSKSFLWCDLKSPI